MVSLGATSIAINSGRWDEMPTDIQAIIQEEATRHAELTLTSATGVWDQDSVANNMAGGMVHTTLSAAIVESLRQAALSVVLPNWVTRAGGPTSEAVQIFNEVVAPIFRVRVLADGTIEEF